MSRPWHLELGDGRSLPCRVIRNRRYRRIGLRVTLSELRITAPAAASRRDVASVAEHHRAWVRETLDRLAAARPRDAVHGDPLPRRLPLRALETDWELAFRDGLTERITVRRQDTRVVMTAPSLTPAPQRLAALRRFLMREAREVLAPRLQLLAERHGLAYARLTVRAQRSRWGSCSGHGTISLNYRLVFLPPALVDYVLCHELAHTVERNHSARFWSLLESICPQARARDRELDHCADWIPAWTERC
jgi:predicted metal-dependent hydrolase